MIAPHRQNATMEPYTTPKSLLALDEFTKMSIEAHWRELVEECIRGSEETGEPPKGETRYTND